GVVAGLRSATLREPRRKRHPGGIGLGHLVVFDPMAIAVIPCRGRQCLHPGRHDYGEAVKRSAEFFPDALQPVEHTNGRYYMCGVRALTAADFEEPLRPCEGQHGIEEELFRLPSDKPGAELAQDSMVEAWVSEVQPQDILPINTAADSICSLAIGEPFGKLEDGGQRQACRRFSGLATHREQGRELCVLVDSPELIGHLYVDIPMRERGPGNALGFFRYCVDGVGV